jgi:hypothetical protein
LCRWQSSRHSYHRQRGGGSRPSLMLGWCGICSSN